MAKTRKVPKDKRSGLPKKYLSGLKGSRRAQLAQITKRISRLYKEGKKIPQTLIDRRIKLGRSK